MSVPARIVRCVLVIGFVGLAACGGDDDDDEAAATTTSTTQPPLTKEEYIRQGDAVCANHVVESTRLRNPDSAANDAERVAIYEQNDALFRKTIDQFKALKPPPADQATADQLNSLLDQSFIKETQLTAAARAGDRRSLSRIQREVDAVDRQFSQLARSYGFVSCANVSEP